MLKNEKHLSCSSYYCHASRFHCQCETINGYVSGWCPVKKVLKIKWLESAIMEGMHGVLIQQKVLARLDHEQDKECWIMQQRIWLHTTHERKDPYELSKLWTSFIHLLWEESTTLFYFYMRHPLWFALPPASLIFHHNYRLSTWCQEFLEDEEARIIS